VKARVAGGLGQGQWAWLLEEANRRIKFPTWPGRRVFLDAPLRCEWGPGDAETLSAGAEIGVEHLHFLRDGAELVRPRPAPPRPARPDPPRPGRLLHPDPRAETAAPGRAGA